MAPTAAPKTSQKTVQDAIPDAVQSRAPARAHYARPSPVRPLPIGASTRAVTDESQASAMRSLAEHVRPGITLRIERTRPSWAAGFLEDFPIEPDSGGINGLLQHLRDEHGGQHYRLTALGAGDQVLYTGSIPISGPVRDQGRPITRADWEEKPVAVPKQTNPLSEFAPLIQVLGTLVQAFSAQQEKQTTAMLGAVRDIAARSASATSEIAQALAERAPAQDAIAVRPGMGDQLTELLSSVQAIEQVKAALGVKPGGKQSAPLEEEGALDGAVKEVSKRFMTEALTGMLMRGRNPAATPAPTQRVPPRPIRPRVSVSAAPTAPTLATMSEIPDALTDQTGQPHPSN